MPCRGLLGRLRRLSRRESGVIGYKLLVIGYWLLVIGYKLLVIRENLKIWKFGNLVRQLADGNSAIGEFVHQLEDVNGFILAGDSCY
jgi:hypothetical protein